MFNLKRLAAGDVIRAEWLNAIVDEVKRLGTVRTSGVLYSRAGPGGLMMGVNIPDAGKVAKTGGSTIAAISGSTPGSGAVTFYDFNGSTLTARSDTLTVYNLASVAVEANTWIMVKLVDGYWFVDWEQCPA
jgi:hypothetical protein